ncbi:MAG: folate-binding protein YgfZ [Legionellaceae bacterium]|nr:folate-binding protein YgfZ [Legionellaceae bacterium]
MQSSHFLINNRNFIYNSDIETDLSLKEGENYIFKLEYLDCLNVVGENASDFLQGQLSCDVMEVNNNQMRPSTMCNLQGRVTALIDVFLWKKYHLLLPNDLSSKVQKVLNRTAMFSKVKVAKDSSLVVFGFYLQNPDDKIPLSAKLPNSQYDFTSHELYCCYKVTDNLYIFITNKSNAVNFQEGFSTEKTRGDLAWHHLYLNDGGIEIYSDSSGVFLPHRLGLQKTKHISFNKGCYIGQEIIARMHYRSKLKHDRFLYTTITSSQLHSGQKIFDANSKSEIGEVIDFSPTPNKGYLLAISAILEHSNIVTFEGQENDIPHTLTRL